MAEKILTAVAFQHMAFECSAPKPHVFPEVDRPEIAFAGRSNSGKSSALNAICGRKNLARTSKTPGRTQMINFFVAPGLRLADLPGYGYAKVSASKKDSWRTLIETYLSQRKALAAVVLIMDARRPLGEFDRTLLAWGQEYGLTFFGLLTKADKLGNQAQIETRRRVANAVGNGAVLLFSATRRQGVDTARDILTGFASDAGDGFDSFNAT